VGKNQGDLVFYFLKKLLEYTLNGLVFMVGKQNDLILNLAGVFCCSTAYKTLVL